jgi:hypothetical protein
MDHDWRSKKAPIRLVCNKGPECMKHDWFNPKNPIRKLTRDEIVGTAEEIEAKRVFDRKLERNEQRLRNGWDYGECCHEEEDHKASRDLKCNVNRW